MVATALVIGPRYTDLRGIEQDVKVMTKVLRDRGFVVRQCVGDAATRKGILAAYEDLIDSVGKGDPAVVFYSGHGSVVEHRAGSFEWQYIVPTDYPGTGKDDFRGITSVELSLLQRRLQERSGNVTVILDCCHAGFMSRDPRAKVKAMPAVPQEWVAAHHERLVAAGLRLDRWNSEGDRDVVRITACTTRQTAAEWVDDDGVDMGVLTSALTWAMDRAGDEPVTWAAVMDCVRQRVIDLSFEQRPAVEGPEHRLLFQTVEADLLMSLPVSETGDGRYLRLRCAPLLGVQHGDEFVVMPRGAIGLDVDKSLGTLVVETVGPLWADGAFTFAAGRRPGMTDLTGARAFPSRLTAPRVAVKVPTEDPRADALVAALRHAPLVCPAAPDDGCWKAEVRIEPDGGLTIWDRIGPLHEPRPAGAGGVLRVLRDLKILAQATQLKRLTGAPRWALDAPVRVEWGLVVDGEPRPVLVRQDVRVGDQIYVRVHNDGPADVYVAIIDIGLSGKITVVTGREGGWRLREGDSYTFGLDELTRKLTGKPVSWPPGLAPGRARPESLQVYVMSDAQDLRVLEQEGIAQKGGDRGGSRSPLLAMLDQLRTGADRDVPPERTDVVRYDVHQFDFDVRVTP